MSIHWWRSLLASVNLINFLRKRIYCNSQVFSFCLFVCFFFLKGFYVFFWPFIDICQSIACLTTPIGLTLLIFITLSILHFLKNSIIDGFSLVWILMLTFSLCQKRMKWLLLMFIYSNSKFVVDRGLRMQVHQDSYQTLKIQVSQIHAH